MFSVIAVPSLSANVADNTGRYGGVQL